MHVYLYVCMCVCFQVNPAFDTYRIGTIIEMVRSMALALAEEEGLRVRVCVQQPLGEVRGVSTYI